MLQMMVVNAFKVGVLDELEDRRSLSSAHSQLSIGKTQRKASSGAILDQVKYPVH